MKPNGMTHETRYSLPDTNVMRYYMRLSGMTMGARCFQHDNE